MLEVILADTVFKSSLDTSHQLLIYCLFLPIFCLQTLVQVGLYAMFRDSRFFSKPLQFNPERWIKTEDSKYFRGLSFGFGPRQCLGRRIAEMEMQLFLIHVSPVLPPTPNGRQAGEIRRGWAGPLSYTYMSGKVLSYHFRRLNKNHDLADEGQIR